MYPLSRINSGAILHSCLGMYPSTYPVRTRRRVRRPMYDLLLLSCPVFFVQLWHQGARLRKYYPSQDQPLNRTTQPCSRLPRHPIANSLFQEPWIGCMMLFLRTPYTALLCKDGISCTGHVCTRGEREVQRHVVGWCAESGITPYPSLVISATLNPNRLFAESQDLTGFFFFFYSYFFYILYDWPG